MLQSLVGLGGKASTSDVLDRVCEQMQRQLNEHDLSSLASGDTPRWRNTAQWARNTMREEGFIVAGSPHGVWEISEQGAPGWPSRADRPKVAPVSNRVGERRRT